VPDFSLLLDIGNTRIKWARLLDGTLLEGEPVVHTGLDAGQLFDSLWADILRPGRVVVACVAASLLRQQLEYWCQLRWELQPEFVRATAERGGLRNGYRNPDQLGVDRWLAMLGARCLPQLSGAPICVVDCGTALTVDIVRATGEHLGGWIAPGLTLMRRQLAGNTMLPEPDSKSVMAYPEPGRDTQAGLLGGTLHAAVGLILQAWEQAHVHLGERPICLLTGGDADVLYVNLPLDSQLYPSLVLQGLALIAQQSAKELHE